jgi:hypothetical protein
VVPELGGQRMRPSARLVWVWPALVVAFSASSALAGGFEVQQSALQGMSFAPPPQQADQASFQSPEPGSLCLCRLGLSTESSLGSEGGSVADYGTL